MNRNAHHIRLYKRLNLHDSATITDLKKSYRQLASKYHPDKTTQSELGSINADLFNDIQTAYRELKKFHERHGYLPLNPDLKLPEQHTSTPNPKPHPDTHRPGAKPHLSFLLFGLLISLLLILIFLPYPDDRNVASPQANSSKDDRLKPAGAPTSNTDPHTRTPSLAESQTQPVMIGLSMGEVFDLLGIPDSTVNNQWYYGSSEIYFSDGHVSGWHNDPKSPLWTDKSLPSYVTPQPKLP